MFFRDFYRDHGLLSPEMQQVVTRLSNDHADPDWSLSVGFPSFHGSGFVNILGNDVKLLNDYIMGLNLPCLKGKRLYKAGKSIMKQDGFIDWHYDSHARSMLLHRIHIPVITNPSVKFYCKWFKDPTVYTHTMSANHLYSYNNRVPHVVSNKGPDRHHLILDYLDETTSKRFTSENLWNLMQTNMLGIELPNGIAANYIGSSKLESTESYPIFRRSDLSVMNMLYTTTTPDERNAWIKYPKVLSEELQRATAFDE